jgi:hypothetical protein
LNGPIGALDFSRGINLLAILANVIYLHPACSFGFFYILPEIAGKYTPELIRHVWGTYLEVHEHSLIPNS